MRPRLFLSMAVLAVCLGFAPAPIPKKERPTSASIEGLWRSEPGPKEVPYLLKVTATHMTYWAGAGNETVVELTVDSKANPPSYKITNGNGFLYGIYRVQGDRLTLCYSKSVRPTAFHGRDQFLEVYTRVR